MTHVSMDDLARRYGEPYKWYVCLTILLGLIAMISSATIVNVAMPDIMGELGLGQDQAQWLSTGFLAAMTAAMLAASWAVHTFGCRAAYVGSLLAFALASVLGALSPNDSVLIIARIIQGAAAGLAQPLGMVAIFQIFPADRRGTAMGLYGMGVILAPALGPTIGGMLIDNYSWRYVFFLGIPFCLLGSVLAFFFLPTRTPAPRKPFDWLGFILLALAISSFLAALSNGQREGWDSAFVIALFALAAVSLIGFIVEEQRAPTPILALAVYCNARFAAASIVAFILGVGLYGSTYLVPLFVQTIQGYTPTESGLLLMPAGLALGVVFPLSGRLSDRIAPHRLIFLGLLIFGVSNLLMQQVDVSTDFWTLASWVAIGRIGLGLILPSLNSGALRVLDPHLLSDGAGAINFIRQLGGAIGVDILSVYLERQTSFYAAEINALEIGGATTRQALNTLVNTLHRAGLNQQASSSEAYKFLSRMIEGQGSIMGFRAGFVLVAVIFFAALLPAWFMRPKRVARPRHAA